MLISVKLLLSLGSVFSVRSTLNISNQRFNKHYKHISNQIKAILTEQMSRYSYRQQSNGSTRQDSRTFTDRSSCRRTLSKDIPLNQQDTPLMETEVKKSYGSWSLRLLTVQVTAHIVSTAIWNQLADLFCTCRTTRNVLASSANKEWKYLLKTMKKPEFKTVPIVFC